MEAVPFPSTVRLLLDADAGDGSAWTKLLPLVYDELHAVAQRELRRERPGHTLQPTALVHEAWLKLRGDAKVKDSTRRELLAAAAGAMRRVLVDYARKHAARKRGGGGHRVTLSEGLLTASGCDLDVLALDEALVKLAALDERQARIVELRFFAGLTGEETAAVLGVSRGTVEGDWAMARAWLRRELGGKDEG